jgi:hypothetical protein
MSDVGRDRLARAFAALAELTDLPDHGAFERLVAMVVHRWLGERTVHDVTLRGTSQAPHQVDVLVGDHRQRALIECKYYARKIDMPVVRNFYGAVEDIGCDLAAIVTTVGFSANVETYAAAKGIDLLLLREARDEDLDGRIKSVQLDLTIFHVSLRSCRVQQPPDPEGQQECSMSVALDDPSVVIKHASGRLVPFADRYYDHYRSFGFDHADGVYPVADVFEAPTWLVAGGECLPVERIDWEFTVSRGTQTTLIEHEPLLSLVSHDGAVLEVVSEAQLAEIRFQRAQGDTQ